MFCRSASKSTPVSVCFCSAGPMICRSSIMSMIRPGCSLCGICAAALTQRPAVPAPPLLSPQASIHLPDLCRFHLHPKCAPFGIQHIAGILCILHLSLYKVDHVLYFLVRDERPLNPLRLAASQRIEKHVALSYQPLLTCQGSSWNHDERKQRKRSATGYWLDQASYNICGRSLGRNDQMHPGRSCLLRQTTDRFFHLRFGDHHQVSQLG